MEGRCVVDTLSELGCLPSASTRTLFGTEKVIWNGGDVLLSFENDEVHIFNTEGRKLTTVLQFPGPVVQIVQSEDKRLLYTACQTDGVNCVNLPSLISRFPSTASNQSPDAVLIKASPDWLAVRAEGVCSLMLIGATLLTVSLKDSAWWFTLFSLPVTSPSTTTSRHEKTAEVSLPVVPAALCDDEPNANGGGGRRQWKPVLACAHSGDASSSAATLGDGHFHLEPVLFNLLFGIDAGLNRSPVVLSGLPDGRLCFFPLRFPGIRIGVLHSLEQPVTFIGSSVVGETRPGSVECMVAVGRRGRVLLVRTGDGGPEEGGKVARFSEGCVSGPVLCACTDSSHLYYSTGSDLLSLDLSGGVARRPGPGVGEAVGHAEQRGQGPGGKRWNKAAVLQSPVSLNVCRVIALASLPPTNTGEVELLALSNRGRLQRISLPKGADGGVPSILSSQVGQRIRDLLAAIGNVCERGSVSKSALQMKNKTLTHLNQVLNISHLILANQTAPEEQCVPDRPIRCCVVAKWSRVLQRDCLNLSCVLENSSPYVLDRGWTLCVRLLPLSRPLSSPRADNSFTTFSFPFRKLHPGEKLDVTLPLATAGDTSFPMSVSCSLVFSLQSLLGKEELTSLLADKDQPGLDSCHVSLTLDSPTLDWLDVLRVGGAAGSPHANAVATETTDMTTVETFLNNRGIVGAGRTEKGGGSKTTDGGPFTASVKVSSELLRTALGSGSQGPDFQSPKKVASPSLSSLVLGWLLSGCASGPGERDRGDREPRGGAEVPARGPQGGAEVPARGPQGGAEVPARGPQGGAEVLAKGPQGGAEVLARGPGGHTVKLTAVEVGVEEIRELMCFLLQLAVDGLREDEEGPLDALELRVESSSMVAVCGLHHAVLRRVQVLLQRTPGKDGASLTVQGLKLRRALQHAETLLEQIQHSHISEGFGLGLSATARNKADLLKVYTQLRQNPLLII